MYRQRKTEPRSASEMWPVATWQLCRNFVFSQLANRPPRSRDQPLIIGVQGPQGSGKSALVHRLAAELGTEGYGVQVQVVNIDDLCYPSSVTEELAESDPSNPLRAARGMPSTHDLALGERMLANLRGEPEPAPSSTDYPIDDSLYVQNEEQAVLPVFGKNEPERSETPQVIAQPRKVDVFLVHGWCLGLAPLGPYKVVERYREFEAQTSPDVPDPCMLKYSIESLQFIDQALADMARRWVSRFDAFVQLWPVVGVRTALQQGDLIQAKFPSWDLVCDWRGITRNELNENDDLKPMQFEMTVYEMWAATGKLAKLAPYSPVGPGKHGDPDPWLKSVHAQESMSRATDVLPEGKDEEESNDLPHALPQRIIRIDIDRRRSVQHFTLM